MTVKSWRFATWVFAAWTFAFGLLAVGDLESAGSLADDITSGPTTF